MKVVYLAHQLSAPTREGIEANRRNAALWAIWLEKTFGIAISADWIWATGVMEETEENRRHGLERDVARVAVCHWFWMVGGKVSSGMQVEQGAAVELGKRVLDLTHLGYEPPYVGSDYEAEIIRGVLAWIEVEP